jgi:hypothetical protein
METCASEDEKMICEALKITIMSIKTSEIDEDALPDGILKHLFTQQGFAAIFSSLPPLIEFQNSLPRDLYELLTSTVFFQLLLAAIPKIATNGALVIEGIVNRGKADGQVMDIQTKAVIVARVAQEALAREIITLMPTYLTKLIEEQRNGTTGAQELRSKATSDAHVCHYLGTRAGIKGHDAWSDCAIANAEKQTEDAGRALNKYYSIYLNQKVFQYLLSLYTVAAAEAMERAITSCLVSAVEQTKKDTSLHTDLKQLLECTMVKTVLYTL